MKAKFEIKCEEIGFSRSHEIPLDSRGYCHELADNLEKAMQFYIIRAENHSLKQIFSCAIDVIAHRNHQLHLIYCGGEAGCQPECFANNADLEALKNSGSACG